MEFYFEEKEETVLLKIKGALVGGYQLPKIIDPLENYIEAGKTHFVVELSELTSINSTGLTVLLTILTKSRNAGGDVVLANISRQLNNLLIITKLNSIFVIKDDVEAAVAAVHA